METEKVKQHVRHCRASEGTQLGYERSWGLFECVLQTLKRCAGWPRKIKQSSSDDDTKIKLVFGDRIQNRVKQREWRQVKQFITTIIVYADSWGMEVEIKMGKQ